MKTKHIIIGIIAVVAIYFLFFRGKKKDEIENKFEFGKDKPKEKIKHYNEAGEVVDTKIYVNDTVNQLMYSEEGYRELTKNRRT